MGYVNVQNFRNFPRRILQRVDEVFDTILPFKFADGLVESRISRHDFEGCRVGNMSSNRCGARMSCVGEGRAVRFKRGFQVGNDEEFNRMLMPDFLKFEFRVGFREYGPLRAVFFAFKFMNVECPLRIASV